jgi:hypothetical protein
MSKNVKIEPQIHKIWANLDFLVNSRFGPKKSKHHKSTQTFKWINSVKLLKVRTKKILSLFFKFC